MLMTHGNSLQREKGKNNYKSKGKIVTMGWPGDSCSIAIISVIMANNYCCRIIVSYNYC